MMKREGRFFAGMSGAGFYPAPPCKAGGAEAPPESTNGAFRLRLWYIGLDRCGQLAGFKEAK